MTLPPSEWNVPFNTQSLSDKPEKIHISASDEQKQNLARRFDIANIELLEANLTLQWGKPPRNNILHITGSLHIIATQNCVVSDRPVPADITEEIEAWFSSPDLISLEKARRDKAAKTGQELPILEEQDDPEPFIDDQIDLGELVAQHASLALPAYPRADDAHYDGPSIDSAAQEQEKAFTNPFAGLAAWKDKLQGEKD